MVKRSRKKQATGGGNALTAVPSKSLPLWANRDWLLGLILCLGVIAAYSPVWFAAFVWDDDFHVTANPVVIGPLGPIAIWTTSAGKFCPWVFTTFWAEHRLWGLAPLPYHLVNVLMHATSAILLWRILQTMAVPRAWLGAALWALHPVQVESVAWISEMKNTESCVFFLLTILFFVRWLKENDGRIRGLDLNLTWILLFAFLAMASKPSTVILPLILCLVAWWVEGRVRWRNGLIIAPLFLMAALASTLTIWAPKLGNDIGHPLIRPWTERCAGAGDAVWFYMGKLLLPHPLILIYPRWEIVSTTWTSYLPLLAVILVLLILWHRRESGTRAPFFAFAFFVTALFPVLGLVEMSFTLYSLVADHFQYLASMGPLVLAAVWLGRLADFLAPGRSGLQALFAAAVLAVLGTLSWHRTWAFESREALWTDTLAKNPDCWLSYNGLGVIHSEQGQTREALADFRKALEINPYFANPHNNLGNALLKEGKGDEAIVEYRKALTIEPNFDRAHKDLGDALMKKGQLEAAIAELRMAVKINPYYAQAEISLGLALLASGNLDEAIVEDRKAAAIDPNLGSAHTNLGNALAQKGLWDQAIVEFKKALKTDPTLSGVYYNLGNALAQEGELDGAIAEYQKALSIDSAYAEARNGLGIALARKGDLNGALAQFQEALRLKHDFTQAEQNLKRAQELLHQNATSK